MAALIVLWTAVDLHPARSILYGTVHLIGHRRRFRQNHSLLGAEYVGVLAPVLCISDYYWAAALFSVFQGVSLYGIFPNGAGRPMCMSGCLAMRACYTRAYKKHF
jgi:hypothetical protein